MRGSCLRFLSYGGLRGDICTHVESFPGMSPDDVDFCLQCLLLFVYRQTDTFQFRLSFLQSVRFSIYWRDIINLWSMDALLKSLYFDLKQVRKKLCDYVFIYLLIKDGLIVCTLWCNSNKCSLKKWEILLFIILRWECIIIELHLQNKRWITTDSL